MILLRQWTEDTNSEKRPRVIENPAATPSGGNILFPEKWIMDLRNGITCEVIMGYECNIVVRTLIGF